MTTPEEAVRGAREARERDAVLEHSSVVCECGHHISWHGEDYEGGCSQVGCECGHNAAQAYARGSLDPEQLDAYVRTVRANAATAERARLAARVEGMESSCGSRDKAGRPCCIEVDAVLALLREGA